MVVVDSREQAPWEFRRLTADAKHGHAPLIVPTITRCLAAGDYSAAGYENQIALERKSPGDLFATLSFGRARFERELARLADLRFSAVVVESEFAELIRRPPSRMRVSSFVGSVVALMERFPTTHWVFAGSRAYAERIGYRLLERWVKDREEETRPKRPRRKAD